MKVLTANSFGRPVSFVCNQITRVEERSDSDMDRTWIFTSDGDTTVVDMPYLEVVGFLKGFD